jgi:hypothetical protein
MHALTHKCVFLHHLNEYSGRAVLRRSMKSCWSIRVEAVSEKEKSKFFCQVSRYTLQHQRHQILLASKTLNLEDLPLAEDTFITKMLNI